MRLFTATLATETNTFSPLPTSLESYREIGVLRRRRAPGRCAAHVHRAAVRRPRRARRSGRLQLIEGSCFAASPAGTTNRADYETMRDEILGQLKAAHAGRRRCCSACTAPWWRYGYDDVEGDIIERARAIVGPKCVIGVELDPHCHLTMKRVSAGRHHRALQGVPAHRRGRARRGRARSRAGDAARQVKPVMSVYDCRQIQSYPTTLQPMRGLVDRIKAMEGKDGILSVSIAHCFPYGDVAEVGTRVLVIADGDKKKADALATKLGEELVSCAARPMPQ